MHLDRPCKSEWWAGAGIVTMVAGPLVALYAWNVFVVFALVFGPWVFIVVAMWLAAGGE